MINSALIQLVIGIVIGYIVATLSILPVIVGFLMSTILCHMYPNIHHAMDHVFQQIREVVSAGIERVSAPHLA